MEKYKWILGFFVPIAAIPFIVALLFAVLKIAEKMINKLVQKVDATQLNRQPTNNPKLILISKIIIEILVGLTIFAVCVRILTLPVYALIAIKGADWSPPLFIMIPLIVIPYFFSGLTTFKVIQYIHRHLDLNMNTEEDAKL